MKIEELLALMKKVQNGEATNSEKIIVVSELNKLADEQIRLMKEQLE